MRRRAYDEVADDHCRHEERNTLPVVNPQAVPHRLHVLATQYSKYDHKRLKHIILLLF